MSTTNKKKLNSPIFILDDNALLLEDLCEALQEQLNDNSQVEELTNKSKITQHSHIIYDASIGEKKLYNILEHYAPVNIWLISGKNTSQIEQFGQYFRSQYPQYHKCLRREVFQKPLDEGRLLAELQNRENLKNKQLKEINIDDLTQEIQIHMNLQRPARLIDAEGIVLAVNKLWTKNSSWQQPKLPHDFTQWLKKLHQEPNRFIMEKHWLSANEAETPITQGYFELHSYAMKETDHVVQFVIPSNKITSWQPNFSEENLVELCKPVMNVLVHHLFTRARLYRVKRYPDRGLYKKAIYSIGGTKQPFEGMHKGCAALNKRLAKYEKSFTPPNLQKKIVKIADTDSYWDKIIGMEGVPNWLEIPIIVLSPQRNPKTVALIIFDRKDIDDRLWDYGVNIESEEIKDSEKLLLDAVSQIGLLFNVREKQEYYETRKNTGSWWVKYAKSEKKADELATSVFKILLNNKRIKADDAALIKLRGIEAITLESKYSIDNAKLIENPTVYNMTPITEFKKTRCLYPDSEIPNDLLGSQLENWNKNDYRMLIPTRSGEQVWYIFCFSRKPSNDIDTKCMNCWYRYDASIAQALIVALGDYLSNHHTVKLVANSTERIFIHEAITLFTGMRDALPAEYHDNENHQPMLKKMKQLQYFLDNMRLIKKMSKKNKNAQMSKKITKKSIDYVINNINDSIVIRQLQVIGTDTIQYFNLQADKFLFELVIYNLLNNAVRYAPKTTSILLTSSNDGIYWRLVVSNKLDKIIDEKQLNTLFDPYTSYSQSNRNKGIGLGLANSRSTALDFGGDLKVKQNIKKQAISFELIWPIYNKEK